MITSDLHSPRPNDFAHGISSYKIGIMIDFSKEQIVIFTVKSVEIWTELNEYNTHIQLKEHCLGYRWHQKWNYVTPWIGYMRFHIVILSIIPLIRLYIYHVAWSLVFLGKDAVHILAEICPRSIQILPTSPWSGLQKGSSLS